MRSLVTLAATLLACSVVASSAQLLLPESMSDLAWQDLIPETALQNASPVYAQKASLPSSRYPFAERPPLSQWEATQPPSSTEAGNAAYIDPLIGTAGPDIDEYDADAYGGLAPTTSPPFAAVRWRAVTRRDNVSNEAYYALDRRFYGHQGSAKPAVWMGAYNTLSLVPGFGSTPRIAFAERSLPFLHGDETEFSRAYKHSVVLDASEQQEGAGIYAAVTGTMHGAFVSYDFEHGSPSERESGPYVTVHASRGGWRGAVFVEPGRNEISGWTTERQDYRLGPHQAPNFRSFFAARFELEGEEEAEGESAFASFGIATDDGERTTGMFEGQMGRWNEANVSAYVRFRPGTRRVRVRIGQSLISIDQARYNLEHELPPHFSFDDVVRRNAADWKAATDVVELHGAEEGERKLVYTTLFRASQFPSLHSEPLPPGEAAKRDDAEPAPREAGAEKERQHYYSFYTDSVHAGESYTGMSIWDTWRAAWALQILTVPKRVGAMLQSMLDTYEQSGSDGQPGYLPMWANGAETNIMISTWADCLVAEALRKGIKGFNVSKAWEALQKDAEVPPERDLELKYEDREEFTPLEARAGLTMYKRLGWVAHDRSAESVSRTLDYATCDWCVGAVAAELGHEGKAEHYRLRSRYFRNVFNNETGFMAPRFENGTFLTVPLESPTARDDGFTEGNRWTYAFDAVHDLEGLAELHGGRDKLLDLLDEYFAGGYNMHSNEPSHHAPSLYAALGRPFRSQETIRSLVKSEYTLDAAGFKGNEDCGQMSAWYWFQTVLGVYPLNPASGTYVVGSPHFERVVLHLPSGKSLEVLAPGAKTKLYVSGLRINGKQVKAQTGGVGVVVTHEDIVSGGKWEFDMSGTRSSWGEY